MQTNPRVVRQIIPPNIKEINSMAKNSIKTLVNRIKRGKNSDLLRYTFSAWSQNIKLLKVERQLKDARDRAASQQPQEKVLIKQQLEVYDGTKDVWNSVRTQLVEWAFQLYSQCNSYMDPHKQ